MSNDRYVSPLSERYASREMQYIFSPDKKFRTWRRLWIALAETEKELGFFLTFGDNLAHIKPIAHLYQSELKELAEALGTSSEVIQQEPSAGFWSGQTDLEDFSYWILNDGPIVYPRNFTDEEVKKAELIKKELSYQKIDQFLFLYHQNADISELIDGSGLSAEIIHGLIHIVEKAKKLKNRDILLELKREV